MHAQREPKRLQETATMTSGQKSVVCSAALLLCASATNLHAQAASGNGVSPCFVIHVRLNGKAVTGPQVITFKTKDHEEAVPLEGGCFKAQSILQGEKAIDVFFT